MKIRSVNGLVKLALSQPGGPSYLLLRFEPSVDETQDLWAVSQALPWLRELGEERFSFFEDLRGYGMGVVACADRQEARQRLKEIRGGRISATLFTHNRQASRRTRNPALQRLHGIYPTPPPLVGYLARSVHRLLQARFGWSAGLADPRVRLLDPAAGSMNFLRAAWRLALEGDWHQGRREQGDLVHKHLLPHFLGVELIPEAHARGLASPPPISPQPTVASPTRRPPCPLSSAMPRAGRGDPRLSRQRRPRQSTLARPVGETGTLDHRSRRRLLPARRQPLGGTQPKWLQDDAVRFLRLAQWKIDQAGEGIAALVLPHNGLDAPTFRGLRASLLDSFEEIYALDLHGNQQEAGEEPGRRAGRKRLPGRRSGDRGLPPGQEARSAETGAARRPPRQPAGQAPGALRHPCRHHRLAGGPSPRPAYLFSPRRNGWSENTGAASPCRRSSRLVSTGVITGETGWR